MSRITKKPAENNPVGFQPAGNQPVVGDGPAGKRRKTTDSRRTLPDHKNHLDQRDTPVMVRVKGSADWAKLTKEEYKEFLSHVSKPGTSGDAPCQHLFSRTLFTAFAQLGQLAEETPATAVQLVPKQIATVAHLWYLHLTDRRYDVSFKEDPSRCLVKHTPSYAESSAWVLSNVTGSGKTEVVAALIYVMSRYPVPEAPCKVGLTKRMNAAAGFGYDKGSSLLPHIVVTCGNKTVVGQWNNTLTKWLPEGRVVFFTSVTDFRIWVDSTLMANGLGGRQEMWEKHFCGEPLVFVTLPNKNIKTQLARLLAAGPKYDYPNGRLSTDIGPVLDTCGVTLRGVIVILDELRMKNPSHFRPASPAGVVAHMSTRWVDKDLHVPTDFLLSSAALFFLVLFLPTLELPQADRAVVFDRFEEKIPLQKELGLQSGQLFVMVV